MSDSVQMRGLQRIALDVSELIEQVSKLSDERLELMASLHSYLAERERLRGLLSRQKRFGKARAKEDNKPTPAFRRSQAGGAPVLVMPTELVEEPAAQPALPSEAGADLDQMVSYHLGGERPRVASPVSTSEHAASRLLRRIEREGLKALLQSQDGHWYCSWRRVSDGSLVASGSGLSREVAICRSVLNLDLGRIRPAGNGRGPLSLVRRAFRESATRKRSVVCQKCGNEFTRSYKPRAEIVCNVCWWRSLTSSRALSRRERAVGNGLGAAGTDFSL
jgi:hypothetical protein